VLRRVGVVCMFCVGGVCVYVVCVFYVWVSVIECGVCCVV